jgi:phage terminase large subunit
MRRLFGSMWFDERKTQAGREALGWYHEKTDEHRGIGLGPEHDWSSNAADAGGLIAVDYELNPTSGIRKKVSTYDPVADWKRKLRQRNGSGKNAMTA